MRGDGAPASPGSELSVYLELTSDWLWRTDASHRFVSIHAGSKLSGQFDPASCLGKTRQELPWEEVPAGFWESHQRQLDAREAFSFVQARRALDGDLHYFEILGRPTFDDDGCFGGYVGLGRDVSDRILAERRVGESEARFRDLATLGSDWFWEQDAEFRFTRFDGGDPGKTGADVARVLGKRRWDLNIVGVSAEQWAQHRAQLQRHEPFGDFEYRVIGDDGKARWVTISGKPLFGPDGSFLGYRGIGREITALKAAQSSLRESEQRYRDIAELSTDWFWEQDAEFRFVRFSEALPRTSRFASEKAVGKTRWELDILGISDEAWQAHRATLERHEPFTGFTYHVRTPEGALRWFSVSGKPLFSDSGEFRGYRGTGRDISAQVEAEDVLRASEHKLRMVVENVPAGLAYFDRERCCRFTNARYRELFAWCDDPHGKRIDKLLPAEAFVRTEPFWRAAFAGTPQHFERDHPMADGGIGQVEVWIVPDLDETGKLRGAFTMLTDVTARKRAEGEVRRLNETLEERVRQRTAEVTASNRELEAFSYSVSHDLRAPLRAIEGFAQILSEDYADVLDDAGKAHLARIRAASMRMAHLIDDLIELGRIARIELQRSPVDLASIARQLFAEMADAADGPLPLLSVEGDLRATGDPRLLRILIENLLRNAIKFCRGVTAPRIELGSRREGAVPVFFMRDNGIGFDMEFADKLFKPFQKLHSPAEYSGNGIGLATVLRVAQRHGGSAWAEGRPGAGATFHFSLGA